MDLEDQIRLKHGNIQMYVLLLVTVLMIGAVVLFTKNQEEPKAKVYELEIKNPEGATSR